jgi:hypothetical protein
MKVRLIGDIHGKVPEYLHVIDGVDDSIQIGDFGMGFGLRGKADFTDNLISQCPGRHRFIRGNHDDPDECARSGRFVRDGSIEGKVMFLGGAASIDRDWRVEGIDWWPGEELSTARLGDMIAIYDKHRPDVLITHECPEFFAKEKMIKLVNGDAAFPSRTRDALDAMYAIQPPKLHVFGHWHHDLSYEHHRTGTRFVCLNELSYMDIDLPLEEQE